MDKETAVELEKLKATIAANTKSIGELEEDKKEWKQFMRKIVFQSITWLVGVGITTALFGYHLPDNVKKAIVALTSDWGGK